MGAKKDPSRLIDAVSTAIGYNLDPKRYEDMIILQKGVYILNSWGIGPMYDFSTYIEGPYSTELAEDSRKVRKKSKAKYKKVPGDVLKTLSRCMVADDTFVSKSHAMNEAAKGEDFVKAVMDARDALDRLISILGERKRK